MIQIINIVDLVELIISEKNQIDRKFICLKQMNDMYDFLNKLQDIWHPII